MSDAPVEGVFGWLRVGCGITVLAFFPVWAMVTALVVQADPVLREIEWRAGLMVGAPVALFWISLALVLVFGVLSLWAVLARLGAYRAAAQREAADLGVSDDAALPADAWDNPDAVVPTGLAPDDPPEPELPPAPEPEAPRPEAAPAEALDDFPAADTDADITDATEEVDW